MIEREPHTVNGKRIGTFYVLDGKYKMYLLLARGEKTKLLDIKTSSWRMPSMALLEAKRKGCEYIGVTHRIGKKFLYYIARPADWYGEHSTASSYRGEFQRALRTEAFLFNSTHTAKYIAKSINIR
ncbi:hypothetical protein [Acinetobacter nosocomialis]|uniref:hypothetical protein n=1 Tax=Acinetobacter nosocomialis TaxID=106654 RepID=UPI0033ABA7D5